MSKSEIIDLAVKEYIDLVTHGEFGLAGLLKNAIQEVERG